MNERFDKAFAFGLYMFAFFLPISISGAQGALIFLMVIWAVFIVINRKPDYCLTPIDPVILLFLGWVLFAALFSIDLSVTLSKLNRYWIFIAYFAVVRACADRKVALRALQILVLVAGIVAVISICQHFFGNTVPRFGAPKVDLWQKNRGYFHAVGLFDHHLTYGNSLAMILIAGMGLVFANGWKRTSIPYSLAVFTGVFGLLFSFARSAWVGFAAGVFILGFLIGKRILVPAILVFALILSLAVSYSPSVRYRVKTVTSKGHNLERIATWTTTVQMIRDHPVFGIGRGNYGKLCLKYRDGYNIHWTAKSHAHNSYLQVGVESGLLALFLFIVWIVVLMTFTVKAGMMAQGATERRMLFAMAGVHTTFAVSSIFQHNLGDAEVAMTWLFLTAITIVYGRQVFEKSNRSKTIDSSKQNEFLKG